MWFSPATLSLLHASMQKVFTGILIAATLKDAANAIFLLVSFAQCCGE
jgi:hypothetical protein